MADLTVGYLGFEASKLALQFLGAFAIARFTVVWALKRYKTEKAWERQLAAYVDLVTAMSEMLQVVGRWVDEELERRNPAEEWSDRQRQRYQDAHRKLDEGIAVALLMLPRDTSDLLTKFRRDLERSRDNPNHFEVLDTEYGLLDRAVKAVVAEGRKTLGFELAA